MIGQFLELGNRYARESDWKDFAIIKFCLFSMGLIAGTGVSDQYRKPVRCLAAAVFFASYIPLMRKLFKIAVREDQND